MTLFVCILIIHSFADNVNVGPLMKGERVMSLSKGFALGGCPSTLTSLWSVDDCSTSEIMCYFYEELNKGNPKDKALQKAKLTYLGNTDIAGSHPYYWAPFILTGNTEAIINVSYQNWCLGVGLLLFAFLGFYFLSKKQ